MTEPAFDLVCCVCTGAHEPADCELARRYVRECRTSRVSPPPAPTGQPGEGRGQSAPPR